MKTKTLKPRFEWKSWKSEDKDIQEMDRALAARIVLLTHLIRDFEHTLLELKNEDCVWGPVHSSVGQEAVAAASIAALRKNDKIAGSHRAHHQFLAKTLLHIAPDDWDPLSGGLSNEAQEAVNRTMAEIMGLAPGYCGGRGGSMHLRYPEAGVLGTSAIVGGGIPSATGAAFAEKHGGTGNVVVCFFGDGAANQGAFHEALNLAGLWRLPIIYFIENNEYAVGTKSDDAAAVSELSVRASSYDMNGVLVEGCDPAALYGAMRDAVEDIREGGKPCLVEARCYRHYHHAGDQPGSVYGYRSKEEEASWHRRDAAELFPAALVKAGCLKQDEVGRLKQAAEEAVSTAARFCTTTEQGPDGRSRPVVRPELWPDPSEVGFGMRSDGRELEGLPYRGREDFEQFDDLAYSDAIAAVTGRWLETEDGVVVLGEEVANFGGGAYGATGGLPARFPGRVLNTPISEAGFIGLAHGMGLSGMRPVVEIMFPDFTLVAADQVFNQIGKARHMYGGHTDVPLVARTRIAMGCGYGAQHSMDPVQLFAQFPGWRIVSAADSFDYIGLFNTAMHSKDPVLIMEHHTLYKQAFPVPQGDLDYCVPFGRARIVTPGEDVTVLAYSSLVGRLDRLGGELRSAGVSAEIIDLRTLDLPGIDYETIGRSVQKTGAVAIVEEAPNSQGIGPRVAAEITERFYDWLDGPVACIGSLDVPSPVSRVLEEAVLLSDGKILELVEAVAGRRWK